MRGGVDLVVKLSGAELAAIFRRRAGAQAGISSPRQRLDHASGGLEQSTGELRHSGAPLWYLCVVLVGSGWNSPGTVRIFSTGTGEAVEFGDVVKIRRFGNYSIRGMPSSEEVDPSRRSFVEGGMSGAARKVMYEGWMVRYGRRKIGRSFIHMRYFVLESRLLAYYKRKPKDNMVCFLFPSTIV